MVSKITALGVIDTLFTKEGANLVAQLSATFASEASLENPLLAPAAASAGSFAAVEGLQTLVTDANAKNANAVESDEITLGGDALIILGSVASAASLFTANPIVLSIGDIIIVAGDFLTIVGIGADLVHSTTVNTIISNVIGQVEKAINAIDNDVVPQFSTLATDILDGLTAVSTGIASSEADVVLTNANAVITAFNTIESAIENVVSNGAVTLQNLTESSTNNGVTVLSSDGDISQATEANPLVTAGYYIAQSGDTLASIASQFNISSQTLQQINGPFSDSVLYGSESISPGGLVHVPINEGGVGDGSLTPLSALPASETYVLDPSSSEVYSVGASLDGSDSGALIIDVPSFGGFDTFDAGTYSGVGLEADGDVDVGLVTASGDPLGTLTFNPSTGAGTFTLSQEADFETSGFSYSNGLTIQVTIGQTLNLTDPNQTPEQALLAYLSQLGDPLTAAQLDQDNDNYLNPAATAYTVTGNVDAIDNNTAADVYSTPTPLVLWLPDKTLLRLLTMSTTRTPNSRFRSRPRCLRPTFWRPEGTFLKM
jgi:LysM repeat protein